MNMQIKTAHLCGPLGQALAVADGETWLYERNAKRRPTSNEVHFFFRNGLEVRPLDPTRDGPLVEDNLLAALDLESRRFAALKGLLIGMDGEVSHDLRCRFMRRANGLVVDRAVASFIEGRFLKPVSAGNGSSESWDLAGAVALARAEGLSSVLRLYQIAGGELLSRIEDEIAAWSRQHGFNSVECAVAIDASYESGLVAMIATAAHDQDEQALSRIFWTAHPAWDKRIATHLVHQFSVEEAAAASVSKAENDDLPIDDSRDPTASVFNRVILLLEQYKSRQRRRGRRVKSEGGGAEILPVVQRQIDWIAGRFEAGHDVAAWDDVIDLVKMQLTDSDPEKLAKSLTSLASQLSWFETTAFALCDLAALCAPDDPAVSTARAEVLRTGGRLDEALAAYDRTIAQFRRSVFAGGGRAQVLRELGRLDEALASYDRTIEEFPDNSAVRNGRAETLRELGRLDEALAAYDRTIGESRDDVFAHCGRAETLRELGRVDDALAAYDEAIEEFPDDVVVRNGRAETLRELGRLKEALTVYDLSIDKFPEKVVPRAGRAETLRALGRLDDALAAYDEAIKDFPRDVILRNGRAETLRELGRLGDALAAYDRSIDDFSHDAVVRNGRAETLRELGRLGEALEAYDQTIVQFPRKVVPRAGRAETLRDLGRLEDALAAYNEMLELFPKNAFAHSGRAETLRALDRLEEALEAYDTMIKELPWQVFARNARAVVLAQLGRQAEARAALKNAGLAPRTQSDWVAAHILCTIDFASGATEELAARVERFAAECPFRRTKAYFQSTLAVVRIALKQTEKARQAMQSLASASGLGSGERAALQLMDAHASAIDGHLKEAEAVLSEVPSNLVPYEQFQLRQIRREIERRFGLGDAPALLRADEIKASENTLIRLEMEFWVDRATSGWRQAA